MKVIIDVYLFSVYSMGKNSPYTIVMCELVLGKCADNQITMSGPELDRVLFIL